MSTAQSGRVGPNAITRVVEALQAAIGGPGTLRILREAALESVAATPPTEMVAEDDVTRLQRAVYEGLGPAAARRVMQDAGRRTADYLLAVRIPRPAQRLLRLLPAALASRVLLPAIARHAWTFAGSGRLVVGRGSPAQVSLIDCPLCRGAHGEQPACHLYAATFQRLFEVLVSRHAQVVETQCHAAGDAACTFEIRWQRRP